jgi:hypothetical protein
MHYPQFAYAQKLQNLAFLRDVIGTQQVLQRWGIPDSAEDFIMAYFCSSVGMIVSDSRLKIGSFGLKMHLNLASYLREISQISLFS